MDLKQIESIFWVVQLGSVTAAARKLNTTQPNISQRIHALERELHTSLFSRNATKLVPTAAGREFFNHSARVLRAVAEMERNFGTGPVRPVLLRLGATDMICLLCLGPIVNNLIRDDAELILDIRTDLTVNLRQLLSDGRLDAALLAGRIQDTRFVNVSLGEIPLYWMAHPRLLPARGVISTEQIASLPILSHQEGSDLYSMMEEWFASDECEAPSFHRFNSLATMIEMARAGLGATVLPAALAQLHIRSGLLKVLKTKRPFPGLRFFLAYSRQLDEATRRLLVEQAASQGRLFFRSR